MPRVNASNGIRPEIRALAVLQLGKTVTPSQINDHVGTGEYAAKYVSFLNTRYGFTITANKDGRKVVSYTMIAEPANAADLRAQTPKAAKAKTAKAPKAAAPKVVKSAVAVDTKRIKAAAKSAKSVADIKAANLAKLKEVAANRTKAAKRVREFDDVTEQFGTSGEVGTSFNVDRDWDSIDGLDLSKLL
jgi:ERCC4-type nuclease